ncbi:DUF3331 domain-containing protein [Paraburkholderia sp. A2WS-5]|uniref:SET domain-containing protein-lysine N-methyltransferase n=1 Tax=unclassified Paraburkholderia TaxID=2615204 RepID=UPI003B7E275E
MTVSEKRLPHVIVRQSLRGRGVFARHALRAGECLIEYKGKSMDWGAGFSKLLAGGGASGNAFFLGLKDGRVVVGARERNPARWINHSCKPNCELQDRNGRIFIRTRFALAAATEITIDYALAADALPNPAMFKMFACHCGATPCRGTMFAVRREVWRLRQTVSPVPGVAPAPFEAPPAALARIRVLERLAGNRILVCWLQPGRAFYGEQTWVPRLATEAGRCALSQIPFETGARVFAPQGIPQPVNRDERILVEAVASLDVEMLA